MTHTTNPHSVHLQSKKRYLATTDDRVDTDIVGVSVGAAHMMLDDNWDWDCGPGSDWRLSFYFNKRLSPCLRYTHAQLANKLTGKPETYEIYRVDRQYYASTEGHLRPLVTDEVGEQLLDDDRDWRA
ncbi:MAG: hypothetical protein P8R02_12245 [Pseudomonadales bacterium]|nr:hypothetical protein [Pseudomonadales bacterium]